MIMNLITLFLFINVAFQAVFVPGTPFYVNGTDNCFYPNATAPDVDFVQGNTALSNLGIQNATDLKTEAGYPTNTTSTETQEGDGTIFNSLYESGEQLYKFGEVMRGLVLGGFIEGVIDNIAFNCYFDNDGELTAGPEHQFWTELKTGINIAMLFLIILTIWYWFSGRGHLLSS